MYLKTILIFSLVCFFTDTMSTGLNAKHIKYYNKLILNCYDKRKIKYTLRSQGVTEKYKYFSLNDPVHIRVEKLLKFLVKVEKDRSNYYIEKLDENEVEIITTEFHKIDDDHDGLIKKEKSIELIISMGCGTREKNDYFSDEDELESQPSSFVACPPQNNTVFDLKKNIDDDDLVDFNVADVMLKVLLNRSEHKNTYYGI